MRYAMVCLAAISLLGCSDDTGSSDDGGSSGAATGTTSTATMTTTTMTTADTSSSTDPSDGSSSGSTSEGSSSGSGSSSEGSGSSSGGSGSSSTGIAAVCDVEGERVYQGDGCNFCTCEGGQFVDCSDRDCQPFSGGCEYDGTMYAYGERFDSTDECNECVCAASGLACTRREICVDGLEEGAILLEDDDELCGGLKNFNGDLVKTGLEPLTREGPLDYDQMGPLYPETLPDTDMSVTVAFPEDGYVVCRIPSEGQEALDLEAVIEWRSDDGAFDEGQHTYVRRNFRGFLMATTSVAALGPQNIHGTYSPGCPDAGSISIAPRWYFDGTADSGLNKTCETDIGLQIGNWTSP